jgi:hypothetical protein
VSGVVAATVFQGRIAEYLGHPGQRTAAAVYNGTFVVIAVCFNLLWRSASSGERLLRPDHDRNAVAHITESYRYGPLAYVAALVVGFISVTSSVVLNLGLALYFALPSKTAATMSRPLRPVRSR